MNKISGKKRLMKHKSSSQEADSDDDGLLDSNSPTTSNMSKVTGKKRLMKHKSSSQEADSDDDLFNSDNKSTNIAIERDYCHQNTPGTTLESIIMNDDVSNMLKYLFTFNITNCNQKECLFITIYDLLLLCCQHNATNCTKQIINTKYNKLMNNILINNTDSNTPRVEEGAVYVDISTDAFTPFTLLLDGNKDVYYADSYKLLPYIPSLVMSPLLVLLTNYQNTNVHNDILSNFVFQYPLHCMQLLKSKICMESCEVSREFPPLLLQLVSDSSYFSIYAMILAMNDRFIGRRSEDSAARNNTTDFTKHPDILKLLRFKDKNDGTTTNSYSLTHSLTYSLLLTRCNHASLRGRGRYYSACEHIIVTRFHISNR